MNLTFIIGSVIILSLKWIVILVFVTLDKSSTESRWHTENVCTKVIIITESVKLIIKNEKWYDYLPLIYCKYFTDELFLQFFSVYNPYIVYQKL